MSSIVDNSDFKAQVWNNPQIIDNYEWTPNEMIKWKVAEIFPNKLVETVKYNQIDLIKSGTFHGRESGGLCPFQNYDRANPHTYWSNLVTGKVVCDEYEKSQVDETQTSQSNGDLETSGGGEQANLNLLESALAALPQPRDEGQAAHHDELAASIISKYLEPTTSANWASTIQNSLQDGHPRQVLAQRVAAMLIQIGDGLSPLPNDTQIQLDIMRLGCQVTYPHNQKGMIIFDDIGNITVLGECLDVKFLDVRQDLAEGDDVIIPGELIMQFEGQRTISVGNPDHEGNVICTITRKYFFNSK